MENDKIFFILNVIENDVFFILNAIENDVFFILNVIENDVFFILNVIEDDVFFILNVIENDVFFILNVIEIMEKLSDQPVGTLTYSFLSPSFMLGENRFSKKRCLGRGLVISLFMSESIFSL